MMQLIDRRALLEAINNDERGKEIAQMRNGKVLQTLTLVLEHIHTAPTIEAEPVKHGRWILSKSAPYDFDGVRYFYYYCSTCDFVLAGRYGLQNYCPCCGAKMDLEEREHND